MGITRRTVKRLLEADEPPRYERKPAGSMLDPLEPVIRRLIDEWPQIKAPRIAELLRDDYGSGGSVDLVRKRMAGLRPREGRPAQRTGYRPGQVLQIDCLDQAYADWRDRVGLPLRHATGRFVVADRLAHEREALRPVQPRLGALLFDDCESVTGPDRAPAEPAYRRTLGRD